MGTSVSSDSEDEMLSTIQEMDSESIGSSISQQQYQSHAHHHHDDNNNNNSKPSDRISPGSTVEFRDLSEETSRQFNGTRGTVETYHDDIQRYTVRCHDDGNKVIIAKRNNLSPITSSSLSSDSNNNSNNTKEVKKKKKKSSKHNHQRDHDNQSHVLEASQQILVDLCNEMKSLQSSIIASTTESTSVMQNNINSNTTLLHQIQKEVNLLQSNMRQLDNTIQHRATPDQISEMGKIRAIQNLLADAQADKNTTVQLYEMHARRGYEEIERLRVDLEVERRESKRLREEVDALRNNYAAVVSGGVVVPGPTGPLSPLKGGYGIPEAYINGDGNNAKGEDGNETIGTFDDMTLESKQTNDNTVAYETKSLKKRIIHMKKKLAVVSLEAKEAGGLRCELERMRVAMETMKKESAEKDKTIQRLKEDIANLKRGYSGVGAPPSAGAASTAASSSVTVVTKKKSGNRWWNNASS